MAAALLCVLLVGVRVDLRGSPAGADTSSIGRPPAKAQPQQPAAQATSAPPAASTAAPRLPRSVQAAPKQADPAVRPRRSAAPQPRRFVWAPVSGASGYEVEFFRGHTLVFSRRATQPEITLPVSWSFRGTRQSLGAGDYQWYVWPLRGGLRAPAAVVQARLAVPAG